MLNKTINIVEDFTRFPAGRYVSDGRFSGERFRRDLLVPALKAADRVDVELDGALGYGSSFLEEAFGGLVRSEGYLANDLSSRLRIVSTDEALLAEIQEYLGFTVH